MAYKTEEEECQALRKKLGRALTVSERGEITLKWLKDRRTYAGRYIKRYLQKDFRP